MSACACLFSQTPAYLHYGVEDGLPSTLVYCTIQDKKGFMWFGTSNGLARFDGTRFKVFGIEDELPDPEVLNLFEDSQERLWISCFQKNPCYLKDGKIFTSENDSLLNKVDLKSGEHQFYEDEENVVWVTGKGFNFCFFNNKKAKCYDTFKKYSVTSSMSLVKIKNKKLFYGCGSIIDFTNAESPKYLYNNQTSDSPIPSYHYLYRNDFFLTTGNQITKISIGENEVSESNYINNIPHRQNRISLIDSSNIWIAYPYSINGAYKIEIETKENNSSIVNLLRGEKVSDILKDKEKNIWFTTLNDGVFAMPEKAAIIYSKDKLPVITSDNFTSVNILPDKKIMIGNDIGEIYILDPKNINKVSYKKKIDPNRVRQIITLPDKGWMAAMDNAVYAEINGRLERKYKIRDSRTLPNHISSPKYIFHELGKVWIAHSRGLHYWTDDQEIPKIVITRKRVTTIGKDSEGNIWIGGIEGLLSAKDSFKINWGKKFNEVSGRIIDIDLADNGYLWVATAELGLLSVQVKNGEIKAVQIINDLIDKKITGIKSLHKAQNGKIWIATNNGIYSLDYELNVHHINVADGLPNNDVNALVIDHDTLWAATASGLAKVQLDQSTGQGNFPTFISGIKYDLNGKNIIIDLINHPKGNTVIPSGASMVDIQISGLYFRSPKNLTYEYVEIEKLLPVQWLTWSNLFSNIVQRLTGKGDTVLINGNNRYFGANAPSGCFEITATAISKDGIRSSYPDTRMISILPHWYETAWFSLVFIGAIGFFIWRFISQRNTAKKFQRAASELQLQAIKAQVNPHFVGNSINAIQQFFYPPDPVRASQYISTFTSLLRRTMHLSEVPFISFKEELAFITDYLEMVKLRFEGRFLYTISGIEGMPEDLSFPAMILQPILENATIHGFAPEGIANVEVAFKYIDQLLTCTITDNGIGIEASMAFKKSQSRKRESKGIALLRKKIEVLNKMYSLDIKIAFLDLSTVGNSSQGTKVTLSFSPNRIDRPPIPNF